MKGLIVCRTGMGSSLMLKIKAQKIIDKHGWNIELEHDVLSGLRTGEILILSSLCAISPTKSKPPDSERSASPT